MKNKEIYSGKNSTKVEYKTNKCGKNWKYWNKKITVAKKKKQKLKNKEIDMAKILQRLKTKRKPKW